MLNRSILCVFCIVGLCMFSGCGKKKNKAPAANFTPITTESPAAIADSNDIFDEFYDDKATTATKKSTGTYSTSSSTTQFDPNGRYVIQVSCVVSKQLAENIVSKLENNGYPSYIAEVENPTPALTGIYQRVRVGGFNGVSQAKQFAEEHLMQAGYDYWIDNRSNDNVGMGGYGLGDNSGYGNTTPATQTSGWGTPEPAPSQEWGTTEPPVQEPVPAVVAPEPAVQEPAVTPNATEEKKPAKKETPEKNESGAGEDEWGSDTSGW